MIGDFLVAHGGFANLIGNVAGNQIYPVDAQGPQFIAAGQGLRAMALKPMVFYKDWTGLKTSELNATKRQFEQYRDFVVDFVKSCPSHYQFLKDNIYNGKDDYAL